MPAKPNLATLSKLEAIANRRRLAGVTPKERCLSLFALMAIREYRRSLAETPSGETVTAVADSPVGASTEVPAPNSPRIGKFLDSRPDPDQAGSPFSNPDSSFIIHHSSLDLDSVPCPPEKPVIVGSASSLTTPTRRAGQ